MPKGEIKDGKYYSIYSGNEIDSKLFKKYTDEDPMEMTEFNEDTLYVYKNQLYTVLNGAMVKIKSGDITYVEMA